jgi:hypothetical protein
VQSIVTQYVSSSPIQWKAAMKANPVHENKSRPQEPDLSAYAGRWVALVGGHIAGVGFTADEARTAAKLSRPKEEPQVRFVPEAQLTQDTIDSQT